MTSLPRSSRERFQARDYDFVVDALTHRQGGSESRSLYSLLMEPEALNECLDHAEVLQRVLQQKAPLSISPELYFYVLVRHALKDAGIDDLGVADYVAANLADYAHGDPMAALNSTGSTAFNYHIDFLKAIDEATTYEKFFLQVRCGNQFMLLTGLFPRFLRHRRDRRGAPGVRFYEQVASDAFLRASDHPLAEEFELTNVYHTLADQFSETRCALNHLASEYLFLDV